MTQTNFENPEAVLNDLIRRYPELSSTYSEIYNVFEIISACFSSGNKLMICGNGGSAADSLHIVGELMKSFSRKRPISEEIREKLCSLYGENASELLNHLEGALPAVALVENTALSTALENDTGGSISFAQQVFGIGKAGDTLLCISTSGNAQNVIRAAMVASAMNIRTILLSGKTGGLLNKLCEISILVPETETYKIQELHLPIYHALCLMLEYRFFGTNDNKKMTNA